MKRICLSVTGLVAATAAAVSAAFICAGCNDGGVESGGGDAVAFLKRFSESSGNIYGRLKDGRDGRAYRTVKIGDQTWMAENLNYTPSGGGSWCYDVSSYCDLLDVLFGGGVCDLVAADDYSYCDVYGRLYDWAAAMGLDASYNNESWDGGDVEWQGVCPAGWHLPSRDEWEILIDYVGGTIVAGVKLKAKTGWHGMDKGTDDFGFSALPGGSGGDYGRYFSSEGESGYWWSSSAGYGEGYATLVSVGSSWGIDVHDSNKEQLNSVRCVKNAL